MTSHIEVVREALTAAWIEHKAECDDWRSCPGSLNPDKWKPSVDSLEAELAQAREEREEADEEIAAWEVAYQKLEAELAQATEEHRAMMNASGAIADALPDHPTDDPAGAIRRLAAELAQARGDLRRMTAERDGLLNLRALVDRDTKQKESLRAELAEVREERDALKQHLDRTARALVTEQVRATDYREALERIAAHGVRRTYAGDAVQDALRMQGVARAALTEETTDV